MERSRRSALDLQVRKRSYCKSDSDPSAMSSSMPMIECSSLRASHSRLAISRCVVIIPFVESIPSVTPPVPIAFGTYRKKLQKSTCGRWRRLGCRGFRHPSNDALRDGFDLRAEFRLGLNGCSLQHCSGYRRLVLRQNKTNRQLQQLLNLGHRQGCPSVGVIDEG